MQMGRRLLKDLAIPLESLNHKYFNDATSLIDKKGELYFSASVKDVDKALKQLYGQNEISLQQLSATFRRGDLIEKLNNMDITNE